MKLEGSLANIFGSVELEPLSPGKSNSLLVANRGEIAIRIIRSAHELGMKAVAIYSYQDRLSPHRYKADESYQIGSQNEFSPVGAYLAIDRIIDIAKHHGITCIHPGYGFLSENATFAKKVEAAGIHFVGPTPEVIESCGDKTKARELALKINVPVVPGSSAIKTLQDALDFVDKVGFPVIIKAAFGGGGRGMRVVRDKDSLPQLYERACSEALSAFGDGTCFLERFIEKPRHIEVQLMADSYGNVVHLYDRDCTVQRRHQKVVEMAPSLNLPDQVRQKILNDAVALAKAVGYRNAGTAEFLVDSQNRHYFIEINPRVQVEHTVTEEVTGIDIVATQIQIALGASLEELGLVQDKINVRGFAIQCRVTTEDPARNFQPDTGRIEVYRSPAGHGVRLDGGPGYSGATISPHYDSLLAKCTCLERDFEGARRKMVCALAEFRVRGVKTNIKFLIELLKHETFVQGQMWTTFIDDTPGIMKEIVEGNRSQKLLLFLGEMAINGPKAVGQMGLPVFQATPEIPKFNGYTSFEINSTCSEGFRNVLLQKGPEAFCQAVRNHKQLLLMDTTWRDAHQSLLATRVRTIDMARIAKPTSHVFKNLFALECWGGATFDVSMRFLNECPWERLKTLRSLVPGIPFQMLLRGANAVGYTSYPDNVVYEFCKKARECGVDIFRVFDSLNYDENLLVGIDAVKKAGGVAEGAISYTGDVSDPNRKLYNLDYYLSLTEKLVTAGIHILAIKDMAGLLKPKAATLLIGTIRRKYPDLVIHVHTHDTAGTGVASMIAAAEAGADVVDTAIDSMSGLTSQPSMGAIVGALKGTDLDTGFDLDHVFAINSYWEQIRLLYSCFDPNVKSSDAGVYQHEMPGGQYTNLLFQSQQLGLGEQWQEIKKAYRIANILCGDITKVTPSSKVVGDFAQFMVAQKLSEKEVLEKADILSFPQSVLEYFQGYLGQPPYGFPEPLRSKILKARNLPKIDGRPGKSLKDFDFNGLKVTLEEKWGKVNDYDVLSAALYPKVFDEFRDFLKTYGDLSSLPTQWFLTPMKIGGEITFDIDRGKTVIVKLVSIGPLNEVSNTRDVFFTLNGEARMLSISDNTTKDSGAVNSSNVRRKADPKKKGEVGAPMSGVVVDVRVSANAKVKIGDPIVVMNAMKLETVVTATKAGRIEALSVATNDSLNANDLIAVIVDE